MALAVAFFSSATQDIMIDAYRIELLPEYRQDGMAAFFDNAYRAAVLVAGALGAVSRRFLLTGRHRLLAMTLFMVVGVCHHADDRRAPAPAR